MGVSGWGGGGAGAAVGGRRLSPAAGGGGGRARRGQHGSRGGSRTQGNPTQRPLLTEAGFWGPHRNPTSPLTPMSGLPPAPPPALRRRLPRGGEGRRPAPSRRAGLPPAALPRQELPGWGRTAGEEGVTGRERSGTGAPRGPRGAARRAGRSRPAPGTGRLPLWQRPLPPAGDGRMNERPNE